MGQETEIRAMNKKELAAAIGVSRETFRKWMIRDKMPERLGMTKESLLRRQLFSPLQVEIILRQYVATRSE